MDSRVVIADLNEWLSSLNRHLVQIAEEKKIKITPNTSLVQIALESAVKAGARGRQDINDIAMEAISRLVGRKPSSGGLSDYSTDYVRNAILAGLVQSLKSNGKSLVQVKRDSRVQEIVKAYRIREQTVDKYYHGETLPNRTLKKIQDLDFSKSRDRADIFSAFDPSREKDFAAFFRRSVTNQARDILRERNRLKNKIINDAARIGPDVERGDISPERNHEFGVDDRAKTEARMLARRFRDELGREPLGSEYLAALELMKNRDADLTDPADYRKFQTALGIDRSEFLKFQKAFLRDLSKVFRRIGVEDFDEAQELLKVAARRCSLVRREIDRLYSLLA